MLKEEFKSERQCTHQTYQINSRRTWLVMDMQAHNKMYVSAKTSLALEVGFTDRFDATCPLLTDT
jgi:hypothetical protein